MTLFNFKPYTPEEAYANALADRVKAGEDISVQLKWAEVPEELLEEEDV